MVSLEDILPPVINDVRDKEREKKQKQIVATTRSAPPYGHRKNWAPRNEADYGDGGAFPECHIAQYPSGVGREASTKGSNGSTSNALAVKLDETGKIKYDVLARQGHSKDKIVYSKLTDLLPSAVLSENDPELQRPSEEEVTETTDKTRQQLEKIIQGKISSALPVRCAEKQAPAQYVRYTASQQGVAFNSGAQQRVIRMMEMPKDPMEPPKFKINKKVPRGPPSPPAPVMHSPTKKVTVKEQQDWRIPPCVSNWKNAKGYTVPLDKRLAADGRGLQSVHINEKFAKLAEALHIADKKAREQLEVRSQLKMKTAQKEKVRKEENLKMLAKRAREDQAGVRTTATNQQDDGERVRDKLRQDRARDRKREQAVSNSKNDSRSKAGARERDVTEEIALGLPQKTSTGGEAQFDQRLFNQSRGMSSGFGDDASYSVYDRPLRADVSANLYRPTRSNEADTFALEQLNANRFVPDKGFSGADTAATRSGPVQFQPSTQPSNDKEEEDLFGLENLLSEAKKSGKRPTDENKQDHTKRRKRQRD